MSDIVKPVINLVGEDGNIFNLLGIASQALRRAGQSAQAAEMTTKAMASGSYHEALAVIIDYCDIDTGDDEVDEDDDDYFYDEDDDESW